MSKDFKKERIKMTKAHHISYAEHTYIPFDKIGKNGNITRSL